MQGINCYITCKVFMPVKTPPHLLLFLGGSHSYDTMYSGKWLAILETAYMASVFHSKAAHKWMKRKILISVWWENVKKNPLRFKRRRLESKVKLILNLFIVHLACSTITLNCKTKRNVAIYAIYSLKSLRYTWWSASLFDTCGSNNILRCYQWKIVYHVRH